MKNDITFTLSFWYLFFKISLLQCLFDIYFSKCQFLHCLFDIFFSKSQFYIVFLISFVTISLKNPKNDLNLKNCEKSWYFWTRVSILRCFFDIFFSNHNFFKVFLIPFFQHVNFTLSFWYVFFKISILHCLFDTPPARPPACPPARPPVRPSVRPFVRPSVGIIS